MSKIQQELINQTLLQLLPVGHKRELIFTPEDLSYTLQVTFVDLQNVIPGVQHSYSEVDTLIKYSEAQYSPISADSLKLATPHYYQELEVDGNSELIADDLESAYIQSFYWQTLGNGVMELMRTLTRTNFCMFCTAIDPNLSHRRDKQMKCISTSYDSMAKIENPSEFAMQLGRDVGEYITLHNNLKRNHYQSPPWHNFISFYKKQLGFTGEYLIFVEHGPVTYLDTDQIAEMVKKDSEAYTYFKGINVIPFVKRERYKEQQEYRFIVSIQGHILDKKEFYLKISPELRNLVSPVY